MPEVPEVPEVPPPPTTALETTAQMAAAWDFLVSLAEVIGSVRLYAMWEAVMAVIALIALMPGIALIWGDGGDAGSVR